MIFQRLSLIALVALVGFTCIAYAEESARKKELKSILFGAGKKLDVAEVLPLLKELKQINDEDLAKIPGLGDLRLPIWFGQAGEVRRLNDILKLYISAGEVDENKAKNLDFVNHLTYQLNSEINSGVYYNIHPYLDAGVNAWWDSFKKSKNLS